MQPLIKGKYVARHAQDQADISACLALRAKCFGPAGGLTDHFDAQAQHILVENNQTAQVVACFRILLLQPEQIATSYSAGFYDLKALTAFDGAMLELGRFCICETTYDPDVLRIAWAALTAFVDKNDVAFLFGCSSFAGVDPTCYLDALALLRSRNLAPARWMPQKKSPDVFEYAAQPFTKPDLKRANAQMPPLLRTYLMMGGWVSDHAVIDREMNTVHVFTGLELNNIPVARKKLLRALV